jgi:DNA-binding response OmpR family regulator
MRTVLVIDDHFVTLETICLILKKEGYKVFAAKNSQEAQEHFLGNEVDLVIVDHGLPGITGSELARRLKEIKRVSVLMLSGNTDLLEKPQSVDALLPKPVSVHILLAEINRLTSGTPPDVAVADD